MTTVTTTMSCNSHTPTHMLQTQGRPTTKKETLCSSCCFSFPPSFDFLESNNKQTMLCRLSSARSLAATSSSSSRVVPRLLSTTAHKEPLVKTTRHHSLPIAVVSLNAPPVNALSPELVKQLLSELVTLQDTPAVRGIVLTSTAKGIFSAGVRCCQVENKKKILES